MFCAYSKISLKMLILLTFSFGKDSGYFFLWRLNTSLEAVFYDLKTRVLSFNHISWQKKTFPFSLHFVHSNNSLKFCFIFVKEFVLFVILNSNLSLTNWCAEISAMYQFVVAPHASRDCFYDDRRWEKRSNETIYRLNFTNAIAQNHSRTYNKLL